MAALLGQAVPELEGAPGNRHQGIRAQASGGKENRVRGLRDLHVPETTTPPPAAFRFSSPSKHAQGGVLPRLRFPRAPPD